MLSGSASTLTVSGLNRTFTCVMACISAESPSDPFHRRLRRIRCLLRRFDYCWASDPSQTGLPPAETHKHSRRTNKTRSGSHGITGSGRKRWLSDVPPVVTSPRSVRRIRTSRWLVVSRKCATLLSRHIRTLRGAQLEQASLGGDLQDAGDFFARDGQHADFLGRRPQAVLEITASTALRFPSGKGRRDRELVREIQHPLSSLPAFSASIEHMLGSRTSLCLTSASMSTDLR